MRKHTIFSRAIWSAAEANMGDTWITESFHFLLKIVHTDEMQLFIRKTLSKTSPLEMGLHEHNGALYWIDDVKRG